MKYVIVEIMYAEVPIIFPDNVLHETFRDMKPISAGRFRSEIDHQDTTETQNKDKIIYETYGDSKSLKLKPRPEDADIIKHAFEFKE